MSVCKKIRFLFDSCLGDNRLIMTAVSREPTCRAPNGNFLGNRPVGSLDTANHDMLHGQKAGINANGH